MGGQKDATKATAKAASLFNQISQLELFNQAIDRFPIGNKLAVNNFIGNIGRSGIAIGCKLDSLCNTLEIQFHQLGFNCLGICGTGSLDGF